MTEIQPNIRQLHVVKDDLRPVWEPDRAPVLFHHGIGTDHRIWTRWVPIIAARHTVWRFDLRGFGASPKPEAAAIWELQTLLDDALSVIDQTGAEKVHLVGESFGGSIVLALALRYPDRVASVQISNASYKGMGIGELEHWDRQFDDGGAAGWSRRMMINRFGPTVGDPKALEWFEAEQARTLPHVALGLGRILAGLDLGGELQDLKVPLSVVLPDSSPFVPVRHGVELLEQAPGARLRVVPECRHGLVFSHAVSESKAYLDFLAGLVLVS
jgi:pimeloyl-ACP methyl ester carboxylesterase